MEKTKRITLQLFWLVLFFVLAVILFGAWLGNCSFSYNAFGAAFVCLGWLAVFGGIYYGLGKVQSGLHKYKYIILAVFLGALGVLYGALAVPLQQTLVGDLGDVYKGAVIWTVQGNSEAFESFRTYFYVYPNNLGLFVILQGLFRVLYRFGIENFYFAAVALNIASILLGVLFLFLYVDESYGTRKAVFALALFAGYLPMYFFSSVFYTDTMCFAFLPAVLYLNKKARNCKSVPKRILWYLLMGTVAAVGYQIKPTVLIVAIAVLLETLFTQGLKPLCAKLACFGVCLLAVNMIFDFYIYNVEKFADKAAMQENAIPATHWVMMGLKDDGDYDQADYEYTVSFSGREARIAANKAEIANRIERYGFGGMISHLQRKTVRTFGSGNADTATYLNLLPKRQGFLHQICLEDGKYYPVYDYLCQGYWLALLVLCLIATGCICRQSGADGCSFPIKQGNGPAAVFLCNKDTVAAGRAFYAFAPAAAVLGLYLFYLAWEASQRYTLSFIPMFIILAVCGTPVMAATARKKWQEEKDEPQDKR